MFTEVDGAAVQEVHLSELFEDGKDPLILYSFMHGPTCDAPCPTCSVFLDSLNENAEHVGQRVNLAVVAKAPVDRVQRYANGRGCVVGSWG